jgi:hypothetical protein
MHQQMSRFDRRQDRDLSVPQAIVSEIGVLALCYARSDSSLMRAGGDMLKHTKPCTGSLVGSRRKNVAGRAVNVARGLDWLARKPACERVAAQIMALRTAFFGPLDRLAAWFSLYRNADILTYRPFQSSPVLVLLPPLLRFKTVPLSLHCALLPPPDITHTRRRSSVRLTLLDPTKHSPILRRHSLVITPLLVHLVRSRSPLPT